MESEDEAQRQHLEAQEVAKKKGSEVKAAQSGRQSLNKAGASGGRMNRGLVRTVFCLVVVCVFGSSQYCTVGGI